MICEHCDKAIAEDDTEVVYREDGSYHENCYLKWSSTEEAYWAKQYRAEKAVLAGGYEWGDPKNPEYVEWAVSAGDDLRKS